MRRKGLWLSVLATALIAGSASADIINNGDGTFTYEGNNFNFFTYDNTGAITLTAPQSGAPNYTNWGYTQVDPSTGVYQSAGTQGDGIWSSDASPVLQAARLQTYDFEQAFWGYVGDETGGTLHIGMVLGKFVSGGIADGHPTASNGYYNAGDLFVGLGNTGANDYAVGLSTNELTGQATDARQGTTWGNTGWTTTNASPFLDNSPWRVASGGQVITAGNTGFSTVEWTQGVNQHNFVAIAMHIADADAESLIGEFGSLSLHWTMECGNDVFNGASLGELTPVVPIPAAAPMGLLGMGLLALVRRVRRRPEC